MFRTLPTISAAAFSALLLAVPAMAQDSTSGVEVTDPGDQPRTELRYEGRPSRPRTPVSPR